MLPSQFSSLAYTRSDQIQIPDDIGLDQSKQIKTYRLDEARLDQTCSPDEDRIRPDQTCSPDEIGLDQRIQTRSD